MTPREFLEIVVRPNVTEFHTNYSDIRHAHNAISAVDALAAHVYVWAKANRPQAKASSSIDDGGYRNELAKGNSEFSLLRDIAKAQKHVHLTRGQPLVTSESQVTTRPISWGEGKFGEGRFGGVAQVVVDISPSEVSFVETLVDKALALLESEMTLIGA